MYLKTIELQGFKSFPDKTVIEFDKGMTAIVGANGSGKSNISDAVRWVLGEMSAKSLRGNKMEDVIFNGSSKRKPANYAEVIMTIDNSDFLMKIDYDEVSVGRRLYRSGESEYFLNKAKVRLKDVVELFLNTGIGREGYSVISQGKIAEIISLKGNERRELFEEAAGISRFRYRKNEATAKLATVTENAVRINDILSEVQGRIPRLEAQSEKAKKYIEINNEKRDLELGIWNRKTAKINEIEKNEGALLSESEKKLQGLSDSIDKTDARLDEMYVEAQKDSMSSEIIRGEINEFSNKTAEISGRLSVLENEIHHFDLRKEEILNDKNTAGARKEKLVSELANASNNLLSVADEMEKASKRSEDNKLRSAELTALSEKALSEENELLSQKEAISGIMQSSSLEMKEKEGKSIAHLERKDALAEAKKGIFEEKARAEAERENTASLLTEKSELLRKLRIENGDLNLGIYKEKEALEEAENALNKSKLEKLEAEKTRDTLLRMERLLEGFSDSVKEVMLAKDKVLKGICGPVSKIISTDEEYVCAIETSLGGNMQNVIVEDESNAKEAIAYLKNNRMGRATFLPLTTVKGGVWRCDNITEKGFIGIASELCKFEEKYAPAVEHLLGKVLICDNIDTAARIARGEKFGVKVVTLDGQVINAGGSFTGGQVQNKSGVISRTRDINNLNQKIEEINADIKKNSEKVSDSEKKISALRRDEDKNSAEIEKISIEETKLKNDIIITDEKLSALEKRLGEIDLEESEMEKFAKDREAMQREYESKISSAENEISDIEAKLSAILERKNAIAEEKESIFAEEKELSALTASLQVRLENAASEETGIKNAIKEIEESEANTADMIASIERSKEEAIAESENLSAEKERLANICEEKKKELGILTERINNSSEESNKIRIEEKEMIAEKEKMLDIISRKRGILAGAQKEKNDIIARLAEEYELNLESEEFIAAANTDIASLGGEQHLYELRKKIRNIGPVNLESVAELREAKERFDFLNAQYSDITKSKEELEKLIFDLEGTMREMFSETFEEIRYSFRQIFTELFGGGQADIELTDKEDLLNCGVEIKVQPPGKLIKNLSLLSGGEQAFVAIALYMALLKINPSPFCIFDEIESALDEANVKRFAQYIKNHNDKTQFIVITHRRGTMEEADTLYGIAMQEKGVSDFIKLSSDEIGNYATDSK